jgi:hypothetical protein
MGLYSLLAKLLFFGVILAVSYFAVGIIVGLVYTAPAEMGLGQQQQTSNSPPLPSSSFFALFSSDALLLVISICVGVFFTIPLSLAMFGHAGAWLKHVVSRGAGFLGVALACTIGVFLAGDAVLQLNLSAVGLGSGLEAALLLTLVICLLLFLVSRTTLLKGIGIAYEGLTAGIALGVRRRSGGASATVELKTAPTKQIREKEKPEMVRAETIRFQRLIQSLSSACDRVEFTMSFREGRGRVLLSATSRQALPGELQHQLLAMARIHLPEYSAAVCKDVEPGAGASRSLSITGVPEAVENPLEPLSRYFIENGLAGDYVVTLERSRVNVFHRMAARSRQRRVARKSGGQLTKQAPLSGEQESAPIRDHVEEVRLEESAKLLERTESRLALKCWVTVAAYAASQPDAELAVKGASSVIMGSLSGHRHLSALKVGALRDARAAIPHGKPTLLLPGEAVPYVWIPQHAMGTAIAPSAEFELPPKLEGEVELGKVVLQSGPTKQEARIRMDTLTKHTFLTGMTGTGKTTSAFNLLIQLHRLGVPFLVIEPVKDEYRGLAAAVQGLQVFTPGDEDTAPFRLNIFEPPTGVRIQTHLENLEAVWNACFVMYSPLPLVIKEILAETYRACGWSVRQNKRGRPITLADFRAQCERVSRRLGYERKVLMDIEAALRTRTTSLTLGGKGPLFDTIASTPIETILRRPTVVELRAIQNNEEKAFVATLLLMNAVEYIEARGRSKELRHLTLVEEAHRLLPNVSTQKGDPEAADPRKAMVEQFANMLAEVRAYGEGLVLVEQIPTKILSDAIKNTATKIAHRVPAADDREVLAGAMNLTEEQSSVFTALRPGEAIVSVEGHPLPIRVDVPNVAEMLGVPASGVSDEEVRRQMSEFYLRNPLPRRPPGTLADEILGIVESGAFETGFRRSYEEWRKTGATEPLSEVLQIAARSCASVGKDDDEVLGVASKVLILAAERYLELDDERVEFPAAFMQQVERSMRNGRKA